MIIKTKQPSVFFRLYQLAVRCAVFLLFLLSPVYAGGIIEQNIKVSFIYNFAKFVTWADSSPSAPLIICVSSSMPLNLNLRLLQDKKVNARPIQVRFLDKDSKLTDCQMLFMSLIGTPQSEKMLSTVSTFPILTVSDKPDFVQAGGMIGLKELDNRLRFDINLVAAKKAGLMIDSQLADLADEVIK